MLQFSSLSLSLKIHTHTHTYTHTSLPSRALKHIWTEIQIPEELLNDFSQAVSLSTLNVLLEVFLFPEANLFMPSASADFLHLKNCWQVSPLTQMRVSPAQEMSQLDNLVPGPRRENASSDDCPLKKTILQGKQSYSTSSRTHITVLMIF